MYRVFVNYSLLCGVVFLAACHAPVETVEPPFAPVLEKHLTAIQSRDLSAFESTITENEELVVIFPGGQIMKTRTEVMDFHKEWFTDDSWSFDLEQERIVETPGQRVALMRTHYQQPQEDGSQYESRAWLSLTFGLENGEWRLVHDQNTRIPIEAKEETDGEE